MGPSGPRPLPWAVGIFSKPHTSNSDATAVFLANPSAFRIAGFRRTSATPRRVILAGRVVIQCILYRGYDILVCYISGLPGPVSSRLGKGQAWTPSEITQCSPQPFSSPPHLLQWSPGGGIYKGWRTLREGCRWNPRVEAENLHRGYEVCTRMRVFGRVCWRLGRRDRWR